MFVPQQVPFGFKICLVPTEIASWLICLLRSQPQKEQWNQAQAPSKLSLGRDISNSSNQVQSQMILTSTISPRSKKSRDWAPLLKQSEKEDSVLKDLILSRPNHVEPPSTAWHRPFAWQIDLTQNLTKMENLLYFYTDNSEDTSN